MKFQIKLTYILKPVLLSLVAVLFCASSVSAATITNGDFGAGLSGWTAAGNAYADSGRAVLGDADGGASLYQGVALGAGDFVLEFDFLSSLSDEVLDDDSFSFIDAVFATLYFTDDLASFDLASGGADALALLDVNGSSVVATNGSVTASSTDGWQHFSLQFNNSFAYVIPVVELFDMNFIAEDSSFRLDNVSITGVSTEVPEPASMLLLGLGILGAGARAGLKRKSR